jgi:DSF synthase
MTFVQNAFKSVNEPIGDRIRLPQDRSLGCEIPAGAVTNWSEATARGPACFDQFDHFDMAIDPDGAITWGFMRPHARPCFTPELLREIRRFQQSVQQEYERRRQAHEPLLKYVVLGSRVPTVYNLGGDLGLFSKCIRSADREALQHYADLCIEVVYNGATSLDLPVITIALVQGDALGGGFEAALACNLIIAEKSAKFGLPEVLFNLFPGMGAYNLLSRRLDVARAEKIILSGRIYSAEEMQAMGIVDLVVEDGLGEEAVRDYAERHLRRHQAERAVYFARQLVQPVRLTDLRALTELWVDTALALSDADLRKIERLAAAQDRRRPAPKPLMVAAE